MSPRKIQVGIAVVAAVVVTGLFFLIDNPFNAASLNPQSALVQQGQLVVQDEAIGTGVVAQAGDTITVNYTGKLEDGTVFDSSVGKAPYTFVLGSGAVISGWDLGLTGMKVGGKRLLAIPSELGYGATGYGPIPPNASLVFEVELLNVAPGSATVSQ